MAPVYWVFGINLSSDFPFANRLLPGAGPADLTFLVSPEPAPHSALESSPPVYLSRYRNPLGDSAATLHRLPDCEILRIPTTGDFYLRHDRIVCHPAGASGPRAVLIENSFLGPVFAYWLERRDILTLHASVVGFDGTAVALLADHGGGKSGLAAEMMRSAGARLLADDIAAVEESRFTFQVKPGYPQMRMWPDEADHFLGHSGHLPLAHPDLAKRRVAIGPGELGEFHPMPLPLVSVYIAQRREAPGIEIRDLSPVESILELIRHSFAPELMEASGLQPGRLDILARLVRRVSVRRLVYPSGFERLPEVVTAVADDQRRSSAT